MNIHQQILNRKFASPSSAFIDIVVDYYNETGDPMAREYANTWMTAGIRRFQVMRKRIADYRYNKQMVDIACNSKNESYWSM